MKRRRHLRPSDEALDEQRDPSESPPALQRRWVELGRCLEAASLLAFFESRASECFACETVVSIVAARLRALGADKYMVAPYEVNDER